MSRIRVLGERELRECVRLDMAAVDTVQQAFEALARGDVVMPPVLHMSIPQRNAEVDVKTAYVPGLDGFAIKMSPGFFDNPALGLPSLNGLMVLFSAHTGVVEALLLDNGYLTDVRTAAAGAVAARHLAPVQVDTVAVLGAGMQARMQARAAHLVRPFRRLCVWARNPDQARECAIELAGQLEIQAHVCASVAEAVAEAQIVITATASRAPLIEAAHLHPGLHITAMGADADYKNEIHASVLAQVDRLVVDSRSQSERLGELHHAMDAGVLHAGVDVAELGQIVAGDVMGRGNEDDITVCDLTGTGIQDTAIAVFAAKRAAAADLGREFES